MRLSLSKRLLPPLVILAAVILAASVLERGGATGAQSSLPDIVLRPGRVATVAGAWAVVSDTTAADGVAVRHPNAGAAKLTQALAAPANYFELTFTADAGIPYRLWMRGRAQSNYWGNDSVFVQFSNTVDAAGATRYRIGTTSAFDVNLEDCSGCGLSGWGWQDTGWGADVLGPEVIFAASGVQTMRVQTREDGFTIDQIVLSPQRYLTSSPGALKNDTTIVPQTQPSAITVVRRPYLQQMSSSRVVAVWATREPGAPQVRLTGAANRTITGVSRFVPASRNGLGFDYYHHEVAIEGLSSSTSYNYDALVGDVPIASAAFETAAASSGEVSFIAFGDSGTGSTPQRQLAALMANDSFDIALHTGDIAYGNTGGTGDATYKTLNDWFFDIYAAWLPTRPFFPSEGNHDSRPSNGNGIAYLDAFTLPTNGASPAFPDHAERYYSFDYGPVHFVALDTEFAFQDATRRAEQLSWLEADLASTAQPWKIAFFHRSPYSAGTEHGSDLVVRSAFAPIFETYGVQLVLSGHDHNYERTHPIRESAGGTAVTYVVTGGGGGPLYTVAIADWTAYSASRHHYVRGDAAECTLTLRAIGLDGAPFDSATLTRCVTPTTPEVVLYAAEAPVRAGAWVVEQDATAAGGGRIRHPNAGAAKLAGPLAQPANFFELKFDATAGVPYRLWLRLKADSNSWANDSVFVQFDRAVSSSGAAQFRIGTTSATAVNLEECSGCGIAGWGWEDNGWGRAVPGPQIYFQTTGLQRIRVQTREDGVAIDQIVLSPERYLNSSPGALKNDTTILVRP